MNKVGIFRWATLIGYFALMALIFCWHLWVHPLPAEHISITLLMQMGPLMFPLRGLLHGKAYTHAWASYMALFYFIVGVWYGADSGYRTFGILMCCLSMLFFIGTVFYARFKGQAQRNTANET